MNRKLLVFAALFFSTVGLQAQVSYGVKAGVNFAQTAVSNTGVSVSASSLTSFNLGAYIDAPVAANFSFQPGISLQGKGGKYAIAPIVVDDDLISIGGEAKVNLMYLEVPLNFVYYLPTGNSGKFFVGAGPYAGLGLRAKTGDKSNSFSDAGLKTLDVGLNFLVGFKLNNGFLINGCYGLGLTNMDKETDTSMKNRVFSVGVGFQI